MAEPLILVNCFALISICNVCTNLLKFVPRLLSAWGKEKVISLMPSLVLGSSQETSEEIISLPLNVNVFPCSLRNCCAVTEDWWFCHLFGPILPYLILSVTFLLLTIVNFELFMSIIIKIKFNFQCFSSLLYYVLYLCLQKILILKSLSAMHWGLCLLSILNV